MAGGLQSPVLASHSPKASSDAIEEENSPLPTLLPFQESGVGKRIGTEKLNLYSCETKTH